MALHPELAADLAPLADASWGDVLRGEVAVPAGAAMNRDDVEREDRVHATGAGPLNMRVYTPASGARSGRSLVWAHGGGWMFGALDMPEADSVAQVVAAALDAVVVSVDYTLVPHATHPTAAKQIVTAVGWVREKADELGVARDRVGLGGASAGGHLAALAALTLRDRGRSPDAIWLAYPATDPISGPWESPHPECPPVLWLGAEEIAPMFAAYAGVGPDELAARAADGGLIPAAADLAGLPPTLVTTVEADGLLAQGRRFSELLEAAGVEATHHHVEGLLHGYLNHVLHVPSEPYASQALDEHVAWLGSVL